MDHDGDGDNGDVGALAFDIRFAKGNRILFLGYVPFDRITPLVLEEEHRIVAADGCLEQALDVVGGDGHHHLQSRHVAEPGFEGL